MRWLSILTLLVAATAIACGGTDAQQVPDEHGQATSNQATDPAAAGNPAASPAATSNAPANLGGHETNVTCCVDKITWQCPTSLACMGGFDFGACIQGCGTDTDCLYGCGFRARTVKGPTKDCKRLDTACAQ